jgi:hypothetical protein
LPGGRRVRGLQGSLVVGGGGGFRCVVGDRCRSTGFPRSGSGASVRVGAGGGRRALEAVRAGMLMRVARMVSVRALAWNADARVPVARVRLWAIAVRASQAAFAWNDPLGRWASALSLRSAKTCSMMAWRRCWASAWTRVKPLSVNTAW